MPKKSEERISARPFWSGTLSFGLVSVPVNVYPANRQSRVPLRMLGPDGIPLSRQYYSPETGKPLQNDGLVRGYEIDDDHYILVADEELEKLAPEKSRDIDLRVFVPEKSIPPLFFERGYFLGPANSSAKAYRLLAKTMERTGRAGIATFVMRGKEYLVAILSENGILRAETMRFEDEIRAPKDVGLPEKRKVGKAAVRRALKAIDDRDKKTLSLDEMRDETSHRLLKLAEKKFERDRDVVQFSEHETRKADVIDIISQLKKSLGQANGRRVGPKAKRGTAKKEPLADRSRHQLYEQAKDLEISGRSSMSRRQLIQAIKKAA